MFNLLYNTSVSHPLDHFTSNAKVKVLQTLAKHSSPLPLRQIASLSRLCVYSAKRAVDDFKRAGIIRRTKSGNRTLIMLQTQPHMTNLLNEIFHAVERYEQCSAAEELDARAKKFLNFNTKALAMIRRGRESLS